jgi:uncharacterized small protein (DUF1192 family)
LAEEPLTADELAGLRQFLSRLMSKELTLSSGGVDVTQEEIGVLKREIARLERVLARGGVDSGGPGSSALDDVLRRTFNDVLEANFMLMRTR